MFSPQAKVQQQNKRLIKPAFTDDWRYLLQSNEANNIQLKAGLRLQSLCILPVSAVPHQWSSGQKLVRFEALRGNPLLLNAKTHKRLNRMRFDQTKQDGVQIFTAILFFKPPHYKNKQLCVRFFPQRCYHLNESCIEMDGDVSLFAVIVMVEGRVLHHVHK